MERGRSTSPPFRMIPFATSNKLAGNGYKPEIGDCVRKYSNVNNSFRLEDGRIPTCSTFARSIHSSQVRMENNSRMESDSIHQSTSMPQLPDRTKDENAGMPADGLPNPVPGPTKGSSNYSWPIVPGVRPRKAFFISPFPLRSNAKAAKTALDKKKTPSSDIVVLPVAQVTKQATNSTARSDATEAELEHEIRMDEMRRIQEFPRRLLTAAVGGIFVVVPMVVMSIDRTLKKCLITSSVAILLFGATLAWCSTSDEAAVFIATAGYAAFLAVFVAVGDK
ncbi:hypothetical protein PG990_004385 [Apiospora arundinis]